MKTSIIIVASLILCVYNLIAQDNIIDKYLDVELREINADSIALQEYNVSLKWQNLDALNGKSLNCNEVDAKFFYDPADNKARWQDVKISSKTNFREEPENSVRLYALDGFEYESLSTDFLKDDFYQEIPSDLRDLAKWLVSDGIQMHGLAYYVLDSLKFQHLFRPLLLEGKEVKFQNWVTFTNRYQLLTWSAITRHNNEICAVIKYESEYNPVEADTPEMSFKGRSLYYGEIWVSLIDRQVEYSVMFEDVVMNLKRDNFPDGQLIDLQRQIIFNKVR